MIKAAVHSTVVFCCVHFSIFEREAGDTSQGFFLILPLQDLHFVAARFTTELEPVDSWWVYTRHALYSPLIGFTASACNAGEAITLSSFVLWSFNWELFSVILWAHLTPSVRLSLFALQFFALLSMFTFPFPVKVLSLKGPPWIISFIYYFSAFFFGFSSKCPFSGGCTPFSLLMGRREDHYFNLHH